DRARRQLDEGDVRGAARERLEAERARAREQIEHAAVGQLELERAHPRLAYAIRGGTRTLPGRRGDRVTAPPSRDDPHVSAGRRSMSFACSRLRPFHSSSCRWKSASTRDVPGSKPSSVWARPKPTPSRNAPSCSSETRACPAPTTLQRTSRAPRTANVGDGLPMPNGPKWRSRSNSLRFTSCSFTSRSMKQR